jgi:hypothetical protein
MIYMTTETTTETTTPDLADRLTDLAMAPITAPWAIVFPVGKPNMGARVVAYLDADPTFGCAEYPNTGHRFFFRVLPATRQYVGVRDQFETKVFRFDIETIGLNGRVMAAIGRQVEGTWKVA